MFFDVTTLYFETGQQNYGWKAVSNGRRRSIWLTPVEHADSYAFSAKELNQIRKLVEEHQQLFIEKWNEFFSK